MVRFKTVKEYKEASLKHLEKRLKNCLENLKTDIANEEKRKAWLQKYEMLNFCIDPNTNVRYMNKDLRAMTALLAEDVEEWARFSTRRDLTQEEIVVSILLCVEFDVSIASLTYICAANKMTEEFMEELVFITSGVLFDKSNPTDHSGVKKFDYHFDLWDDEHVKCVNACLAKSPSAHKYDDEFAKLFPHRVTHKTKTKRYLMKYSKSAYADKDGNLWCTAAEETDAFGIDDVLLNNAKPVDPAKVPCIPFDYDVLAFSRKDFMANLANVSEDGYAYNTAMSYLKYVIKKNSFEECTIADILKIIMGKGDYIGTYYAYDTEHGDFYRCKKLNNKYAHELISYDYIKSIHEVEKISLSRIMCKSKGLLKPYTYYEDYQDMLPDRMPWGVIKQTQEMSLEFISKHSKQLKSTEVE